jgi:predicted MFS family arabinose efflux permease
MTTRLAKRPGNERILTAAMIGTAISMVPLGFVGHGAAFALAQMGVVALSADWMTTLQVFQMESVDPQWRSVTYGARLWQ